MSRGFRMASRRFQMFRGLQVEMDRDSQMPRGFQVSDPGGAQNLGDL